jgi:hypothetical protein
VLPAAGLAGGKHWVPAFAGTTGPKHWVPASAGTTGSDRQAPAFAGTAGSDQSCPSVSVSSWKRPLLCHSQVSVYVTRPMRAGAG